MLSIIVMKFNINYETFRLQLKKKIYFLVKICAIEIFLNLKLLFEATNNQFKKKTENEIE